ncbi:hypothetical protein ACFE04_000699 [Oxalis oulophora]
MAASEGGEAAHHANVHHSAHSDSDSPTIFDKIINKEIPSTVVYEDDKVLAFRDIAPQAPTHILIIPKLKDGLTGLSKADERHCEILGRLLYTAKLVAKQEGLEDGFRVVINDGPLGCSPSCSSHPSPSSRRKTIEPEVLLSSALYLSKFTSSSLLILIILFHILSSLIYGHPIYDKEEEEKTPLKYASRRLLVSADYSSGRINKLLAVDAMKGHNKKSLELEPNLRKAPSSSHNPSHNK